MLNEEPRLPAFLASLRALAPTAEIVFVDGGSIDHSRDLARAAGYTVLEGPPGRARQMNEGARRVGGDVILFLHVDVCLSADGVEAARVAMTDPGAVAGRFDVAYATSTWPYPWIARLGNLRSRLTKIFTGDQAIFVRRAAFEAVGGYPEIPLMEDVELSRRLRRLGGMACLRIQVLGSTRKWRREGVWRTVTLMWLLRALHVLGVPPARLHRLYYRRDPAKRVPPDPGP